MSCHQGAMVSEVKLGYIKDFLQGNSVLDVGAGVGHYSQWLALQDPTLNITAIDLLDTVDAQGFTYKKMDLEKPLAFNDAEFSTVLAFDVIEHIADVRLLLNELFRVSAPHATLIGSVPHDKDEFLPEYNLTFKHRSDVTHKRYYTQDSLQNALEDAGFCKVQVVALGGVSPHVIAEFFPAIVRTPLKKIIGLLRRVGIINAQRLHSDLFFVASKKEDV